MLMYELFEFAGSRWHELQMKNHFAVPYNSKFLSYTTIILSISTRLKVTASRNKEA